MTPEQYVRTLGRELTDRERATLTALTPALLAAYTAIRALLLQRLPSTGLSRALIYATLRPDLLALLRVLNATLLRILLRDTANLLPTLWRLALLWPLTPATTPSDTPPPFDPLWQRLRYQRYTLLDYLTTPDPAGLTPFIRETLTHIDRRIQRALLDDLPTPTITAQLLTPRIRAGRTTLRITPGTAAYTTQSLLINLITSTYWHALHLVTLAAWTPPPSPSLPASPVVTPEQWEWLAILDPRTCPICATLDGQRRPTPEGFGTSPPAHPRCRCVVLPVTP